MVLIETEMESDVKANHCILETSDVFDISEVSRELYFRRLVINGIVNKANTPISTATLNQTPPTATASVTPSQTLTPTLTPTDTLTPTVTYTSTITLTPTITDTPTVTYTPTITFTPTRTNTPTLTPSKTPLPTNTRVAYPTQAPSTGRVRTGALCDDNTTSSATGRGACSHHGGVKCWYYSDGSCTLP